MTEREQLYNHMVEAEVKAWASLRRYKFQMFGYWAAIWVHLNRIGGFKRPNPFKALVREARRWEHGHGGPLDIEKGLAAARSLMR